MVGLESIVCVSSDLVSVDLQDESVILHSASGSYYGVDRVGQRIWRIIQNPVRVHRILDTLLQEFEIDEQRCKDDLLAFLGELEHQDLIRVKPAEASS
jgi:hypothetical protein